MKLHRHHFRSNASAFTMVEIALCLAIVGFALVAIIGVLPAGLNVQRDNRQDTIINQDSTVWMDAIRAGGRTNQFGVIDQFGMSDELTNYVDRIVVTNWAYQFNATTTNLTRTTVIVGQKVFGGSTAGYTPVLITNGARIVGLLSTPRIVPLDDTHFASNYVIAYCRAMSGNASEKPQQANADVRDASFTYRMVVDVTPVGSVDPEGLQTNEVDRILRDNLAEVRLLFRWPLKESYVPSLALDRPAAGNSKLVSRSQVSGRIYRDNTLDQPRTKTPFYFVQPRDYSK